MIEEFLEFGGRRGAVLLGQISQTANVRRIHRDSRRRTSEFVGKGRFERDDRPVGRLLRHRNGCLDQREPVHLEISVRGVGLLERFYDGSRLRGLAGARQRQSGENSYVTSGSKR